jgi:hypothetical protein
VRNRAGLRAQNLGQPEEADQHGQAILRREVDQTSAHFATVTAKQRGAAAVCAVPQEVNLPNFNQDIFALLTGCNTMTRMKINVFGASESKSISYDYDEEETTPSSRCQL